MQIKSELKVMIADDEPSILMSLEFLFKKEGYKVFIARDGEEAIAIFEHEKPTILILDIMMPKVDGFEVCQYVRKNMENDKVKIVFLSAKNKESDKDKGLELGANLYLTKPFSTRELVKQINQIALDN
jgi:DNA-binding response OmpR family regulator